MTATEVLREEVKHYIDLADDKSLRMVKAMLQIDLEGDDGNDVEDWDELPEELQALLEAGIKDSKEGKVTSFEEVKEKYSSWFRK